MNRIDRLLQSYTRHISLPLRTGLPLSQRVWFLVYPPEDERRLTNAIGEFEIATKQAGLHWKLVDLSGVFAEWMDTFDPEERDQCLRKPDILATYADPDFTDFVSGRITAALDGCPSEEAARTVVTVSGLMDLFDFVHVSTVVDALDGAFPGVLLMCFPGEREGNSYRFLGARTGWNYLAVPILTESAP